MTKSEAVEKVRAAGVAVWTSEDGKKVRIYGKAGSWCYFRRDEAGKWGFELGPKSSWRHLDEVVEAAEAALKAVS